MTPEERERKRQVWKAYKLRQKAGLSKTQEQAERESMAILRANQAAEAARKREEAAREKEERERKEAERIAAEAELAALNDWFGTVFRHEQKVVFFGQRGLVRGVVKGTAPGRRRLFIGGSDGMVYEVHPYHVWPRVELSKSAVFEFEQAPGNMTRNGSVDRAGQVRLDRHVPKQEGRYANDHA